jgi:hypothetical protein
MQELAKTPVLHDATEVEIRFGAGEIVGVTAIGRSAGAAKRAQTSVANSAFAALRLVASLIGVLRSVLDH